MNITLIGIDVAKEVFEVRCESQNGTKITGGKVSRAKLCEYVVSRAGSCRIAMEACGSAHYWARRFREMGFDAVLIAPQFVKPYRKNQKNDANDAEAICIAARQPGMRFVAIKTQEELAIQALHRSRERFVRERTALINQTRGLLLEHGICIKKGRAAFKHCLPAIMNSELNGTLAVLLQCHWLHIVHLEKQLAQIDATIARIFKTNERCKMIANEGGIGPIVATALVANMGSPANYKNGRAYAASLGIVPKQHSTGGRSVLLGITKHGDCYVRKLLIHGSRAVVSHAIRQKYKTKKGLWVASLVERRGKNRAAVALANKTARQVWAILAGKTPRVEIPLVQAA